MLKKLMMNTQSKVKDKNAPNTACTGQVRAFARTFGILALTADWRLAALSAKSRYCR